MTPRQIVSQIVQRATRSASNAALALGLAAAVFAPLGAHAAPLPSEADASGHPDLIVSMKRAVTTQGDPITVDIDIRNVGSGPASRVDVRLVLPFDTSRWTSNDWSVSGMKEDGAESRYGCIRVTNVSPAQIACRMQNPLQGGEFEQLHITMPNPGPGDYEVVVEVDYDHLVSESDEQNNSQSLSVFID